MTDFLLRAALVGCVLLFGTMLVRGVTERLHDMVHGPEAANVHVTPAR